MLKSFRDMWSLLSRRQRSSAIAVALATFAGAILEMLGVGAVPIFVGLIGGDGGEQSLATAFLKILGSPSPERAVRVGGVLLLLLFLLKNVYASWLILLQSRFANGCFVELSTRLLGKYVHSPYDFFLHRNSAELLRNTNQETIALAQNVLLPAIMLATEFLVALCIAGLVLALEPTISLLAFGLLGGSSWIFWLLVRRRSQLLGEQQLAARRRMIQSVAEVLGGVKEVKVLGREDHFLRAYSESVRNFAYTAQYNRLAAQIPRPFIETVAVSGLLLVGAVFLWQGRPVESIVQTLALFAIAVVRLMPSAQRIMASLASVRFNLPSLQVVVAELNSVSASPPVHALSESGIRMAEPPGDAVIVLENITYRYPGQERPALDSLSLSIPRHQMVGFVGPSGSGKSTLLDVVLGLLVPQSGAIHVDGKMLSGPQNLAEWHRRIGFIPQSIYLADSTIAQNVAFGIADEAIDRAQVWAALEAAQLADFVRTLPESLDTRVGERGVRISGGQRQRIGIARALYHRPSVLVMDEATSALDTATEREFVLAVERLRIGTTILVVAHRLTTVETCDVICVIESGRVADMGSYEELASRGSISVSHLP